MNEAKLYWENINYYGNFGSVFWRIIDIAILLFLSNALYKSLQNFNKKYILKKENIRDPFFPQIMIFLFSVVFLFYYIAVYVVYLSGVFFFIIPIVWIVELASILFCSIRKKF